MACGGGSGSGGGNCSFVLVIATRGGGAIGGGSEGNGGGSPSLIFRKRSLMREFSPFFSQMTARVLLGRGGGGSLPLL